MANVRAKGEFETTYWGGPDNPTVCGGVNFSLPYTALSPQDLAPGTINTQSISGFLCSSPWVAGSPFTTAFGASEYVMGVFPFLRQTVLGFPIEVNIVVTNVAFYLGNNLTTTSGGGQLNPLPLTLVHTWTTGFGFANEINQTFLFPGEAVSFIEINGVVYFCGLMLNGVWGYGAVSGGEALKQVTNFVGGRYIAELSNRLVVAEAFFPGGGGTGTAPTPTVAWSGVGIFGQAWDGTAPHDVWNPANAAFFSGNIGGFNQLQDVPDHITGMGTVGQSIIIARLNGLTQQDPNSNFSNSGLQPFNWYHMWASNKGIGAYPNTMAQWGEVLTFRAEDNIYSLSVSGGLTPLGTKIISKILADERTILNGPAVNPQNLSTPDTADWYFSVMYQVNGQLHYLLTFGAYSTTPLNAGQIFTALAYDINLSEGSAHVWDFSQYYKSNAQGAGFLTFSCPPNVVRQQFTSSAGGAAYQSFPSFLLFGGFTSFGTIAAGNFAGTLLQLVPFNYDFGSNPITNYIALMYPVVSVPSTTIIFRGETLSLGHKLVLRRLRLQADNAPLPSIPANAQQQAQTTFLGAGRGESSISPVVNMQGNIATVGQPIHFYYFDAQLSDDSVQPVIASVFSSTNAWQTLCAFRIASASLIGADYQATTQ